MFHRCFFPLPPCAVQHTCSTNRKKASTITPQIRHLWVAASGFTATDTARSQNCLCSEQLRSKPLFPSHSKHLAFTGITSDPRTLCLGAGHEKNWSGKQDCTEGIESLASRYFQVLEILWVYFLATHKQVAGKQTQRVPTSSLSCPQKSTHLAESRFL